jgi:hypothetical protein
MTISPVDTINTTLIQDGQAAGSITPSDMRVLSESAFALVQSGAGAQTASYTAVLSDRGTFVPFNHSSGSPTFTIPTNASVAFAVGTVLSIVWIGSGTTAPAFLAAAGVTINSPTGTLSLRARYSFASAFKYATDTWVLMGDLLP